MDAYNKSISDLLTLSVTSPNSPLTVGNLQSVLREILTQSTGDLLAAGTITGALIQQQAFTLGINTTAQNGITINPFGAAAGNVGEIRFKELAANGVNYIALKAPDLLAANISYVLPTTSPTAGQVLSSSAVVAGVATMSWIAAGGAGSLAATLAIGADANQVPITGLAELIGQTLQTLAVYSDTNTFIGMSADTSVSSADTRVQGNTVSLGDLITASANPSSVVIDSVAGQLRYTTINGHIFGGADVDMFNITGSVLFPDGDVTAPAVIFGDPLDGIGFYKVSAVQGGATIANATSWVWDANGIVASQFTELIGGVGITVAGTGGLIVNEVKFGANPANNTVLELDGGGLGFHVYAPSVLYSDPTDTIQTAYYDVSTGDINIILGDVISAKNDTVISITDSTKRIDLKADDRIRIGRATLGATAFTVDVVNELISCTVANGFGINGTPNSIAALDVQSTTQGVKFPSMTTAQRTAIVTTNIPGVVVFDTDTNQLMCTDNTGVWLGL